MSLLLTHISWPVMRSSFTIYLSVSLFHVLNSYTFLYMYMYQYMHIIRSIYPYLYALSSVSCVNIYRPVFNITCYSVLFCFAFVFKVRCLMNDFFSLSLLSFVIYNLHVSLRLLLFSLWLLSYSCPFTHMFSTPSWSGYTFSFPSQI